MRWGRHGIVSAPNFLLFFFLRMSSVKFHDAPSGSYVSAMNVHNSVFAHFKFAKISSSRPCHIKVPPFIAGETGKECDGCNED